MKPKTRVIVLVVLVAVVATVYIAFAPRTKPHSEVPSSPHTVSTWYDEHAPFWESLPTIGVADLDQLREGITKLVINAKSDVEFDSDLLIRDVTTFLWARSATTPEEYLHRIADYRILRADAFDDPTVHYAYRELLGRSPDPKTSAAELLTSLWQGNHDPANQIVALGTEGLVSVLKIASVDEPRTVTDRELLDEVMPKPMGVFATDELKKWVGPYAQGHPRLTSPKSRSLHDVLKAHRTTAICQIYCAVETSGGHRYPLQLLFYFSPDDLIWQLMWFVNVYPGNLSRPF